MAHDRLNVFTLACHRDVDLAATCLGSLVAHCKDDIALTAVSDGSLTPDDCRRLLDAVPGLTVLERSDLDSAVEPALCEFPHCRKYRQWCPWALKLLDIPLYARGDFVYIDGDILFLRDFDGLGCGADCRFDLVSMYSYANIYSFAFTDRLMPAFGPPLVHRLNAGFLVVRQSAFRLDLVERFLGTGERHQRPFLLEQTAWAALGAATSSGHFDPAQVSFPHIGLDSRLRLKWRPVAMHFLGGTRHLVPQVKAAAASWPRDVPPVHLAVRPSARLTRGRMLLDVCQHRLLLRRCRRAAVVR